MGSLSGVELVAIALILAALFMLVVQKKRSRTLNFLPWLIIGIMILALFYLTRLLVSLFIISVSLVLVLAVLGVIAVFRSTPR